MHHLVILVRCVNNHVQLVMAVQAIHVHPVILPFIITHNHCKLVQILVDKDIIYLKIIHLVYHVIPSITSHRHWVHVLYHVKMDIIPLHHRIVHNVMHRVLLVPILQVHHVHPVVMVFFILRH